MSIGLSMLNAQSTIELAVRSLIRQKFADWELLLFDDGSTDRSIDIARDAGDERIRIFADGETKGLPARLNQAIDAAQGAYFARMDADDVAYPERLDRQVAYLDAHARVDLLGTAMMVFRGQGEPVGIHPVGVYHDLICARPYDIFYLPHPSWMGRIEFFRRWRYDERYHKSQDQDLLRRAHLSSCYAGIAEPLVGYRQDRLAIQKAWQSRVYTIRSIWESACRQRTWVRALAGANRQAVKALVDILAASTGLERLLLRQRAMRFDESDTRRWAEVWTDLQSGSG